MQKLRRHLEIEKKEKRINQLERKTEKADFWKEREEAQKTMQELNSLKKSVGTWKDLNSERDEIETLLEMAREEEKKGWADPNYEASVVGELERRIKEIETKTEALNVQARMTGESDKNNAILTLHSGAGGTEACDWVEMLFRMYRRWAEKKNYKVNITDILAGEEAGIKRITCIVAGEYAYGFLKSETGIHRLVRISPFDANKRRHTSFASCDVIPEISDEIKVEIKEKDLKIDTYRASGHGGQHVNKTDSAVRITHAPTGIIVQCQSDRSQHKNKATAMKLLRAKLFELEQEKKREKREAHYQRLNAIAWGNQIRSYVFCPYTMVKDHRTNLEIGNIESVMNGEIDPFIEAYLSHKEEN
ncbi:peptide chain release factor 2 [bacterium]|nr:peptide chain release factor 2 [bacterium]NIN92215.1 peptide chain release factor 2 [bacterium]NIO18357.1 peptide chain release factor 2 [bacterium]NIO73334.1 peptide chain release factor 2 [bacterium]